MTVAGRVVRAALVVLPLLVAAPSCGRRAGPGAPAERGIRAPAPRGQQAEDESTAPRPESEVEDLALARAIDRKICRKRGCCVTGIEDAGRDRKGRSLAVATIDDGYGGVSSCLVPQVVKPASFGSGALDSEPCPLPPHGAPAEPGADEEAQGQAGAEDTSNDAEDASDEAPTAERDPEAEECRPYEYHLIVHTRGKIRARQLLSEQCNNGYGFAGVGEDTVRIDKEARTFTHNQSGGSNWRWDKGVTVGLDPLRIISFDESTFWTVDENGSSKSGDWNHDTFEGRNTWPIPDCAERRKQKEAAKTRDAGAGDDENPASTSTSAVIVPRLPLPPAFVQDGWRSISLGNCGALVDGDQHGFAIYGGKGSAADASLRAVVTKEGILFVEIADDRWTSGGKTWVKEDHLELWMAPTGTATAGPECDPSPESDPSRQWGIRISDGNVFAAFGAPAPLSGVEVVHSGRVARVRIPIADWVKGEDDENALTIVYSDSDDGLHQKRLIATSELQRGNVLTLGAVRAVDPAHATCVVKGKALQIHRPPLAGGPNAAIADP